MNDNQVLLEKLYQNVSMGESALTNLLKAIKEKDNKIKNTIEEEIIKYQKYTKEISKQLKKYKISPKEENPVTTIISKLGINKEVKNDNSDSAIASTIIEGFTMGNLELEKIISNNQAGEQTIKIAKKLKKFGEEEINKLKQYI